MQFVGGHLWNMQIASVLHETQALLSVEPDRVGHGTFLIPELAGGSELANAVLAAKIPIGKCSVSAAYYHTDLSKFSFHTGLSAFLC